MKTALKPVEQAIIALAFAVIIVLTAIVLVTPTPKPAAEPDWTYAPCAWFYEGHDIPAHTHFEDCINPQGELVAVTPPGLTQEGLENLTGQHFDQGPAPVLAAPDTH